MKWPDCWFVANIQYSCQVHWQAATCTAHKGLFLSKELMCWTYMWYLEASWQTAASDSIQSAWCANWVCFHVPGVEYQQGWFHAALCVCEGVEVQRRFALDVFVIRGEARGLWVALGIDWLFRFWGSGGPRPHICADIPQRAEIKGSGGNLTPVMTPLVLPSQAWPSLESRRMPSESIMSLNWRRPFTRPQWQILLPSYCAGAQMTVNMQRWPALCASYCLLQACVWIISLIHLVIDWSFWLLLSIPDGSRWPFLRVLTVKIMKWEHTFPCLLLFYVQWFSFCFFSLQEFVNILNFYI